MSDVEVFTINEFCLAHRISRSHYYNLRRSGRGPREMQIGNMTRISRDAAAEWRRQAEPAISALERMLRGEGHDARRTP